MGFLDIFKKVFGTKNDREIRKLRPLVNRINELEAKMKLLKDADFPERIFDFRQQYENGRSLDDMLPEVFALVREASVRATGMRHYDVQLIGGIVLHQGKIAEMKTGEGKTLVATLPLVLNGLTGKGVHLVTVNDYLAKRDAEWMGKIYRFLGLSVGVITHELSDSQRQINYAADITYGTNNEFGFDYLRDNMKFDLSQFVQRELNFAIVDEVDSILIDEARTPLIISGPGKDVSELYYEADRIMPKLQKGLDFTVDEKAKTAILTDEGVEKVERMLGIHNIYDPSNVLMLHHVTQALQAHALYKKDIDYMVKDGKVMIIDEFTGRALPGRRWSEGLHQAIEAKEKVKIEGESETLATISFQNYFRLYDKLSGMTGTAETEAAEFHKTYKLDVIVIPTNKPIARIDYDDLVYRTEREKFEAVVKAIIDSYERGQPSLVGTISIERSEVLHRMLKAKGIPHNVLNAKHHEKEAEIVAQAGRKAAVTIATNMAGRGTDIVLGGNPEPFVAEILKEKGIDADTMQASLFIKEALKGDPDKARKMGRELGDLDESDFKRIFDRRDEWKKESEEVIAAGGLNILGTERHDSRRIDNQLRGRSGRQGDPGSSRFFLSLEDDLMRRFGSERLGEVMSRLGMEYGEPIEHSMVSKAIENAQKKVEAHNFEIRKNLLEYDDVMDIQRKTIYGLRREILASENIRQSILEIFEEILEMLADRYCSTKLPIEEWDFDGLSNMLRKMFKLDWEVDLDLLYDSHNPQEYLVDLIWEEVLESYKKREEEMSGPLMRLAEKEFYLTQIDEQWKLHLTAIDHLREGINLQGYRQIDPKLVYKKEAFTMFEDMLVRIKSGLIESLFNIEVSSEEDVERFLEEKRGYQEIELHYGEEFDVDKLFEEDDFSEFEDEKPTTVRRERPKLGRNDPCWCGSGKKYKKCHYREDMKNAAR